jgi:hypothetical protein
MRNKLEKPIRKIASIAIISNPFAENYVDDLSPLYDFGAILGRILAEKALLASKAKPDDIDSYGKGAIVGTAGELEHGHAILHPKLGRPFREVLGGADICKAIIPSTTKMGGPGTPLDVPLHNKKAAFVRSHYDAMEIKVADAPKNNELLIVLAITDGGRPLARIGGLRKEEVKGLDGLR